MVVKWRWCWQRFLAFLWQREFRFCFVVGCDLQFKTGCLGWTKEKHQNICTTIKLFRLEGRFRAALGIYFYAGLKLKTIAIATEKANFWATLNVYPVKIKWKLWKTQSTLKFPTPTPSRLDSRKEWRRRRTKCSSRNHHQQWEETLLASN